MIEALLHATAAIAAIVTTAKAEPLCTDCLLKALPCKSWDVVFLVISTYLTVRETGNRAMPEGDEVVKL